METQATLRFCMGTDGKRKGNLGFAWEPMENIRKMYVLRGNLCLRRPCAAGCPGGCPSESDHLYGFKPHTQT